MSKFTKFAVVGSGGVGSAIVDGLLKSDVTVTILTRDDSKAELQPLKEQGATLMKVDYEDEASLKAALVGNEVVVSTVNSQHLASQFAVARAAKVSGIQLFVPTEFGSPDEDGANITKQKVRDLLMELELPFTLFHSGLWSEYLPFFFGCDFEAGVMSVVGDGNAKVGIVSRADFSCFVVHVLVTASKSSLECARLSIESERVSPKEIAALAEKKLGKKIQLNLVDYEETKKGYDVNPVAYIQTRIADGRCVSGTEKEVKDTITKFFPDWKPTAYEIVA